MRPRVRRPTPNAGAGTAPPGAGLPLTVRADCGTRAAERRHRGQSPVDRGPRREQPRSRSLPGPLLPSTLRPQPPPRPADRRTWRTHRPPNLGRRRTLRLAAVHGARTAGAVGDLLLHLPEGERRSSPGSGGRGCGSRPTWRPRWSATPTLGAVSRLPVGAGAGSRPRAGSSWRSCRPNVTGSCRREWPDDYGGLNPTIVLRLDGSLNHLLNSGHCSLKTVPVFPRVAWRGFGQRC